MNVSGSGYDNPDDAAVGVPMNIYVKVINWIDVNTEIDFDRENWFSSATRRLFCPAMQIHKSRFP